MKLPPIFKHCVAMGESFRYALDKPWREGDTVYATNGWVIVRCPYRPEFGEVPTTDKAPPHHNVWMDPSEFKAWPLDLPELPPPLEPTVRTSTECPECEGDGTGECPHCGSDTEECDNCDGTGEVKPYEIRIEPPRELVAWGQICLNAAIVRALQDEGAAIYLPNRRGQPARFVCPDGCDGLVMPQNPPKDDFDAKLRGCVIVSDLRAATHP